MKKLEKRDIKDISMFSVSFSAGFSAGVISAMALFLLCAYLKTAGVC